MIVDAHAHITPDGKWFKTKHDASLKRLLESRAKVPIDKIVLLPIEGVATNKFISKICRKYQDIFIGFATVNPLQGKKAMNELKEAILKFNLKGLKLHPRLQKFEPWDYRILPILEIAAQLNIPVLFDLFLRDVEAAKLNNPFAYDAIAKRLPELNIILAHSGGCYLTDAMNVAKMNRNIYLDISYSLIYYQNNPIYKDFVTLIRKIGVNKFIYGSDFPEMDIFTYYEKSKEVLKELPIDNQELIYSRNILSLLKVKYE